MSRQECPNSSENCAYYPACYADLHHIYKRNDADTQLKKLYGSLPENTVQLCRLTHEEIEHELGWLPYPEDDVMRDTLLHAGQHISKNHRKQAGL